MARTTGPLRVYVGMIAHETNSFSPILTDLRGFEEDILHRPRETSTAGPARRFPGYGDSLDVIAAAGDEPVAGFAAGAQPSAPPGRAAYEALRNELLADLVGAGRLDAAVEPARPNARRGLR